MFHSAVCNVAIDSTPEKGYWSDGEEVSGVVEVDVKRELQIVSIEAQLRCEERGRVYFKENEEVVDLSAAHFDDSKILWSSESVSFQTPLVNGQLPKGVHKFPFKFTLPNDCHELPSSYNLEPKHDFNGVFWGIFAVIDRDARLRSNYRSFGEIKMLPQRHHPELQSEIKFVSAMHELQVKSHRRPSFMISDGEQKTVSVQGRVAIPEAGFVQTREIITKEDSEFSQLRLYIRCEEPNMAVVKEIIVFVDTTLSTLVKGKQGSSQTVAIAAQVEVNELVVEGPGWQDLTSLLDNFRIYGLPETWASDIHNVEHKVRVQFLVSHAMKRGRTSILEVQVPVRLLSEAVNSSVPFQPPPPPYHPQGQGENAE